MTFSTFYSLDSLVAAVRARMPDLAFVSFDLFDTLVIRRLANPDAIKLPVSRWIADAAARLGIECTAEEALRQRAECEARHRQHNLARGKDGEAVYPEFMREALGAIFQDHMTDALLDEVTHFELALEQSMIVPRQAWVNLLKDLRQARIKTWILTDIYLPATHIRPLLDASGLLPLVDGFTSSADACCAKASGAGFKRLMADQQWAADRWLHVGDNLISDGLRPSELGIQALVLRDAAEKYRHAVYRRYETMARRRPFWKGRLLHQTLLPLEAENQPQPPLYVYGYNFFGPLIAAFVRHVAEQARARNLKRVYFFSREGLTFKRIWDAAAPFWFPRGDAPESRYLYVSRIALAGATCARRGLTHDDAPLALLPAKNRDMRDVCRVFGLDVGPLEASLARYHLTPETPLNPIYAGWTADHWHHFDLMLHDAEFQEQVKQQARPLGQRVERYMEQEGFFEQPEVAVVDIGWLGSIQRFLNEALEHRADKPRLNGFLLSASRGIPYPTRADNFIEGFLFDGARFDFSGSLINYALNIFEEACRAPHAGVVGYEEKEGRVQPVFMDETHPSRVDEREQDTHYAPLQQGLFDAAARFAPALTVLDYHAQDIRPWLNHLMSMRMAFPWAEEVRLLQWKHHVDVYNGQHQPPWRIRFRLTRLWDLPPAFMRVPGIRLGYYLWNAAGLPLFLKLLTAYRMLKAKCGHT